MWEMVRDGSVKCWIDFSNVVKGKYNEKECYKWKNSIGRTIGVKYQWCNDGLEERWFEIVDYNKDTRKLTLKWNENEYFIGTSDLQKGKFGNIFDKVTSKFKYEIGQVVNELTIIDRYYKKYKKRQWKWYKYQCEKGHVHEIIEGNLKKGGGCSVCANRTVLVGYNDLATTDPYFVQFFPNHDEAKKYTVYSNKKAPLRCPFCGYEKTMLPSDLARQGFSCPNCSDGIPLTEKFMSNLLFSKNIGFIYQATKTNFDWITDNSRYDFALPSIKTIIEIDGDPRSHGDRTKDDHKDEMALTNGWNMVRINLLENYTGSFKQLWNKYKPVLNNLGIHITEEEAKECYEKSQTSIFHLVVQIANENPEFNQRQIANKLKEKYGYPLTPETIGKYLKKSNELCLTKYENKNGGNKRTVIICITTGKIYESTHEAERQTGVAQASICSCCRGKLKSAGKDENGDKLVWRYYDEYLESLE